MTRNEITTARRRIHDGSIEERLALARGYSARVDLDLPRIDREVQSVVADYQRDREVFTGRRCSPTEKPRIDREDVTRAKIYIGASWGARILEWPFATAVGIYQLNVQPFIAVPLALIVSIVVAVIFKAIAAELWNREKPRESRHRVKWSIRVCGFLFVIALIPLMLALRAGEGDAVLVDASLVSLAFLLPALSGVLAIGAMILRWSERHAKNFMTLVHERMMTLEFKKELLDFISQYDNPNTASSVPAAHEPQLISRRSDG